jgi:nitroreductase
MNPDSPQPEWFETTSPVMNAIEAIFTRRSTSIVRPDPLPRELVEQLLSAAVQAPNHFRVRPWRFFVLSGKARERLGEVMAQSLLLREPGSPESALAKERSRPLRAPIVIAVAVDPPNQPKVVEIENISAVAAAVENMLIAANALGLGAMWRTGPAAMNPDVKDFFGLPPEQHLLGFVYVGYPGENPPPLPREGYADRTVWIDE